jgi:hypothetical protein
VSLFRSIGRIFKPIEQAIRPFVRPAVGAALTAFAPAAAPLIQAVLSPPRPQDVEQQPQGYFAQPFRVQAAQAAFEPMLEASGFAPAIPIRSTARYLSEAVDSGIDAYDEMQEEYDDFDLEEM